MKIFRIKHKKQAPVLQGASERSRRMEEYWKKLNVYSPCLASWFERPQKVSSSHEE